MKHPLPVVTIVTFVSMISAFAAFQDSTKEAIYCTFVGWLASILTIALRGEPAEAASSSGA